VYWAVYGTVYEVVDVAVGGAVEKTVYWAVREVVNEAVDDALYKEVADER